MPIWDYSDFPVVGGATKIISTQANAIRSTINQRAIDSGVAVVLPGLLDVNIRTRTYYSWLMAARTAIETLISSNKFYYPGGGIPPLSVNPLPLECAPWSVWTKANLMSTIQFHWVNNAMSQPGDWMRARVWNWVKQTPIETAKLYAGHINELYYALELLRYIQMPNVVPVAVRSEAKSFNYVNPFGYTPPFYWYPNDAAYAADIKPKYLAEAYVADGAPTYIFRVFRAFHIQSGGRPTIYCAHRRIQEATIPLIGFPTIDRLVIPICITYDAVLYPNVQPRDRGCALTGFKGADFGGSSIPIQSVVGLPGWLLDLWYERQFAIDITGPDLLAGSVAISMAGRLDDDASLISDFISGGLFTSVNDYEDRYYSLWYGITTPNVWGKIVGGQAIGLFGRLTDYCNNEFHPM